MNVCSEMTSENEDSFNFTNVCFKKLGRLFKVRKSVFFFKTAKLFDAPTLRVDVGEIEPSFNLTNVGAESLL